MYRRYLVPANSLFLRQVKLWAPLLQQVTARTRGPCVLKVDPEGLCRGVL
jgi:hypothetical protein